jgi:L-fuculose-phosphate aldolase
MLRFSADAARQELQEAIIECGRICYDRRLMTSNDGNISARLGKDRVIITSAGVAKGRLKAVDLILMDLTGHVLEAAGAASSSSETPMHLEVYRGRPSARAVIHAHPAFATALTVAGIEFPAGMLPEVMLTLGQIPTAPYATPGSIEDADAIRPLIKDHAAILLRQHGSLTVGVHLEEALIHLERLEHVAEVYWRAEALGKVRRLTPEALHRLEDIRRGQPKR